jgi:quinol monooxygenase YgiN
MIVIAGHVLLDPKHREAAIAAAKEMMAATLQEPGCRAYAFSADLQESGRFLLFECWENEEALKRHFATPHMARFQQAIGPLGVKELAVQRYEVSAVGPLRVPA